VTPIREGVPGRTTGHYARGHLDTVTGGDYEECRLVDYKTPVHTS
jgi:hypothetical protein